jgi:hypothetical protein
MAYFCERGNELYPQGKSLWYTWNRRLSGLQHRSGRGCEEKYFQPLPGPESPIVQPVAQRHATKLSRLPTEQRGSQNFVPNKTPAETLYCCISSP